MSKIKKALSFLIVLCAFIAPAIATNSIDIDWVVDGETYSSTTCNYGDDIVLPNTPIKFGYTFVGWRYPVQQIEYLQSTGQQYIDTGYIYQTNITARVIIDSAIISKEGWRVYGRSAYQFGGPDLGINTSGVFSYGIKDEISTNVSATVGERYVFDLDIPKATYFVTRVSDNQKLVDLTNLDVIYKDASRPSFKLFGFAESNKTTTFSTKIYSAKLYDNGVLVRDMIPVLDSNHVPCMYDRVTEQFFYNAGSAEFIAGPVVGDL